MLRMNDENTPMTNEIGSVDLISRRKTVAGSIRECLLPFVLGYILAKDPALLSFVA